MCALIFAVFGRRSTVTSTQTHQLTLLLALSVSFSRACALAHTLCLLFSLLCVSIHRSKVVLQCHSTLTLINAHSLLFSQSLSCARVLTHTFFFSLSLSPTHMNTFSLVHAYTHALAHTHSLAHAYTHTSGGFETSQYTAWVTIFHFLSVYPCTHTHTHALT